MLNKEEIKKIIPQREPFLMIDEVEEYIPGESCTAYKNISEDEKNIIEKAIEIGLEALE